MRAAPAGARPAAVLAGLGEHRHRAVVAPGGGWLDATPSTVAGTQRASRDTAARLCTASRSGYDLGLRTLPP